MAEKKGEEVVVEETLCGEERKGKGHASHAIACHKKATKRRRILVQRRDKLAAAHKQEIGCGSASGCPYWLRIHTILVVGLAGEAQGGEESKVGRAMVSAIWWREWSCGRSEHEE